jgi:NAD(P)-dependent dehydrogenase (short-subunit alcohol dehydrogenase family)
METLRDRVAVSTGAASAIARAIACALSDLSTQMVSVDADDDGAHALTSIPDAALHRFGRIDIVVTSAGVPTDGLPQGIPLTEWLWD